MLHWSFTAYPAMPPRGGGKPAKRGHVVRHKTGYRVEAKIDKKTVRGPVRATENEAKSDLHHVQLLPNDQYISALTELQRDRRQCIRRGKVVPHKDGFRVQVTIQKKTVCGPCRSTEA